MATEIERKFLINPEHVDAVITNMPKDVDSENTSLAKDS
jgi:CYTH domain-containing protein